jgi:hypothetical protein
MKRKFIYCIVTLLFSLFCIFPLYSCDKIEAYIKEITQEKKNTYIQLSYYVHPEKMEVGTDEAFNQYGVYGAYGRHVMDNMVKLLSSDFFTEKLLLNDEDLPSLDIKWFNDEEVDENGVLKNDILSQTVELAKTDKCAIEKALNIWRESNLYDSLFRFYKNSISYSYTSNTDNHEDVSKGVGDFIKVEVLITKENAYIGEENDFEILSRVERIVPVFIKYNMCVPEGYSGTKVELYSKEIVEK